MRRKGQQAENDKTERVTGLGRRTREEIAKWNQMTTQRFQTGDAIARYYASHTKPMLPTRKSVPRSSRRSDHTKTS